MPFPVKIFPSKLAASVPNNILRNPPLCWLASFWIVSQTLSGNKLESLRDLTISIMSFISSFDIISIVILLCEAEDEGRWPDPNIFLCIPASAVDAAAGNPKGIKTLLASCLITFFISGYPVFSNGTRSLLRNTPDSIIWDIWVFDNLISFYLSAKALRRFAACLLVNNNLWGKLVSSSPIIFDDNLKTTSVLFLITDFNLLSCEIDSFTCKLLYCLILY